MKKYKLLPFEAIQAAAGGDSIAIDRVIKHYSGYIATLCMCPFYDDNGGRHYVVDEDMRRQLEAKLTTAILSFKVA